jgi:hypothetical protein
MDILVIYAEDRVLDESFAKQLKEMASFACETRRADFLYHKAGTWYATIREKGIAFPRELWDKAYAGIAVIDVREIGAVEVTDGNYMNE